MNQVILDLKKELNEIEIESDSEISAIYVARGDEIVKTKLRIIHKKPNLKSRVRIKAVVFDKAKFDLEGLLRIEKGAVGSDTYLKIDCLVMSETASARAVPSLEILESEVKGGHGATIGYIDPMHIYYIKSHGLTVKESEKILVDAFISK